MNEFNKDQSNATTTVKPEFGDSGNQESRFPQDTRFSGTDRGVSQEPKENSGVSSLKQKAKAGFSQAKKSVVNTSGRVVESAQEIASSVADRSLQAGSAAAGAIRHNAVPLTLLGAGLGWWAISRKLRASSPSSHQYDLYQDEQPGTFGTAAHEASQRISELKGKVGEAASQARERIGELSEQTSQHVRELGSQAQGTVKRAACGCQALVRDYPLSTGAIAFLGGALVGLWLPGTRQEDRFLGETRDQLMDQARRKARKVQDAATQTAREAKDKAQQKFDELARETSEDFKDALSS